jgi:hypothetical protein
MEEKRLSKQEQLREEISYRMEWLKIFSALLIVTLGGSISIVLEGIRSGVETFFVAAGLTLSTVFVRQIYNLNSIIRNLTTI